MPRILIIEDDEKLTEYLWNIVKEIIKKEDLLNVNKSINAAIEKIQSYFGTL